MLQGKRARSRALSASHEHYLRAVYAVRARQGYARLTDVARELGVSRPTLSVGVRALEARALVTHDAQRFLLLTPAGERIARELHHRFAVTHVFLRDVLGVPDAQAIADACLLEHDLSDTATERFLDLLKLLHADAELRALLARRLGGYQRACAPAASECATCDLACLGDVVLPQPPGSTPHAPR
jgi:DtxR family Mn-dependent transcriptional regulator